MQQSVFRKGDVVSVCGRVDYVADGRVKVLFGPSDYSPSHVCDIADAVMVTPFFQNGEMVIAPTGDVCEVISVHEASAWLRPSTGGYLTFPCRQLKLRQANENLAASDRAELKDNSDLPAPQTPPDAGSDDASDVEF